MSDPMSDVFKELSYPGKKPLRNLDPLPPKLGEPVDPDWDSGPQRMMLRGALTDFFTVGHLAAALGRKTVTVRSWEAKGWLPLTMYRAPRPKGEQAPGKAVVGRRLYTREQVEVVIAAAAAHGVMTDGGHGADWKRFTATVLAGWKTLA